jgi:OOP family OmpA-OmpF porin
MRRLWLVTLGTVSALLGTQSIANAQEQGFALDRFDPAVRGSAWFALDSLDFHGNLRPSVGMVADYASKPLVLYNADGSEASAIVRDQYFQHFGASMVVAKRLRFGLNLPIAVQQSGDGGTFNGTTYAGPNQSAVGDLRLNADVRLVGENESAFKLAVGAALYLPTGSRDLYTGDGGVRFAPRVLMAGEAGPIAYAASLGLMIHTQDQQYAGIPIGDELLMGASAGVRFLDKHILIGPEIYGRTDVSDPGAAFARHESPLEALLGAHVSVGHWRMGAAGGAGIASGFGSPGARFVGSFDYVPYDRPLDRDHDEILDAKDACPDVPGIATDDPDTNGCPSDRDHDTIVDNEDACPDEPGPKNDTPTLNGCPIAPNVDRDGDGIANDRDACPDTPGLASADPKKNGCPKAVIAQGQIKILEQVNFETGSAKLLPESDVILGEVSKVLKDHPQIKSISVEGHTDDRGSAALNKALSQHRAESVVGWLAAHGIDSSRLSAAGFGPSRPIDSNSTEEGRQTNRRVEFHIVGETTTTSGE